MLEKLSQYIDKETFVKNVLERVECNYGIIFDSFVSNKCNLHCSHCYFLDYRPTKAPLTLERWDQIIDECISCGIKHFHFSGKEPFCDERIFQLLSKLDLLQNEHNLFYGLVTNGTYIDSPKCNELLDTNISYLEISLEGSSYYNNSIRGHKHFKIVNNLINNIKNKHKINITSTVSNDNIESLILMLSYMIKVGVTKFNIAPLLFFKNNKLKSINDVDYKIMLDLITKCSNLLLDIKDHKEEIDIRICLSEKQAFELFTNENILSDYIHKYIYDGKEFVLHIGNHILEINFPLIYIPFLSQMVATNDGYIISCADDIHYKNIDEIHLGNIDSESISQILEKRKKFITNFLIHKLH